MVRREVLVGSRGSRWSEVIEVALALLMGAVAVALLYQLPARHIVDIGGYDAAYVQGFVDAERSGETPRLYLDGSDGSARWTAATSSLLFPQAGLPGVVTLYLSGWRAAGPSPHLTVLLNGQEEVGSFTVAPGWQEYVVTVNSGVLKANDFFLELRADTTRLDDGREVGVLLDRVTYRVGGGIVMPYPAQLVYGSLAAALLWMLVSDQRRETKDRGDERRKTKDERNATVNRQPSTINRQPSTVNRQRFLLFLALILVAWYVLYRNQPPFYPYPIIGLLPAVDIALGATLALRVWQRDAVRGWLLVRPWLFDLLGLGGIVLWTVAVWRAAQSHLTLARPGVENDFRVFATRDTLERIFHVDGFYNLGYPLVLWLVRPFTDDNAFLAGRVIAVTSGALLLASGYWLARTLFADWSPLGRRFLALLTLLILACSPLVVEYGLYVGSDGLFAALVTLALALLFAATRDRVRPALFLLAGVVGGATYLVRHLGFVLLVWGIIHCLTLSGTRLRSPISRSPWLLFLAGFLLAALPQIAVNIWQTGQPLYNQQAKNVWLCVYGNCDWGRWDEAPNSVSLIDIMLRDPGRFLDNWTGNLRAFVGTGGEDTSEFGRAIQLRLLGWPANWLAIAGFVGWLVALARDRRQETRDARRETGGPGYSLLSPVSCLLSLLLLVVLYAVAVCMAFALPRFFLPLTPIYAVAAAWLCAVVYRWLRTAYRYWSAPVAVLATMLLVFMLAPGFDVGTRYVLDGQPPDEVAAAQLVEATLGPNERVLICVPPDVPLGKYSAIAHRGTLCPTDADASTALTASEDATYLLWSAARGDVTLPQSALVGRAGPYLLYKLR